jgi:hypothetical protein
MLILPWPADFIAWVGLSSAYDPADYIARIAPRPVLFIVGERDQITFPELGRELFDAAQDPKEFWLIDDADHTAALYDHFDDAVRRITGFLDAAASD